VTLVGCLDLNSVALYVACALCGAIAFACGVGYGSARARAQLASFERYCDGALRGLAQYRDVERLLASALPRLSARLGALSSPHDLETEARFVVEVREALDRLHARLPRVASVPLPAVSEPVIFLKEDA
jgi:hypothetical protein